MDHATDTTSDATPRKSAEPASVSTTSNTIQEITPKVVVSGKKTTKLSLKVRAKAPFSEIGLGQRRKFLAKMADCPLLTLRNDIDNTSPPLDFKFVAESVLGPGVEKLDDAFMSGCTCRKKRSSLQCKYPGECLCQQDAGLDEQKKICPYHDSNGQHSSRKGGCLVRQYLQSRWHIFECNSRCDCTAECKNRVVQFGRKIRLELFKTQSRGWGLRTMEPLQAGQFIDTYRGEIITAEESDARSAHRKPEEDNYMLAFDKFATETSPALYVCDGKHMGGPSRFINHSCEPNCRLFTVSYNHADKNLYELAFFAIHDIPTGTELTFNYLDQEMSEPDLSDETTRPGHFTVEQAAKHEREYGYRPSECRCGSRNCRGYFFFLNK